MLSSGITITDVGFSYQNATSEIEVIRSLNFCVSNQEIFGLVGPSGCGKTTILKLVADLISEPHAGNICINGTSPSQARQNRYTAILFQKPILLPWRNVMENVLLPSQIAGEPACGSQHKANELLEFAGMAHFRYSLVHELSGGMQQRVNLVRALMTSPKYLLLDEPFVSLDEILKEDLLDLIQQFAQRLSLTVLHVSHSLEDAVFLCDRVAVLTPRPATIAQIIQVPIERPRQFAQRITPTFIESLSSLRSALRSSNLKDSYEIEK
jgi:NitT/TauT family transport system ATP-binding protein